MINKVNIKGETIYLKKSFDGWRVIYPIKDEQGKINWKNLLTGGGFWSLIKILIIVGLILTISWSYHHDTKWCREFMSNPCIHMSNITTYCVNLEQNQNSGFADFSEVINETTKSK